MIVHLCYAIISVASWQTALTWRIGALKGVHLQSVKHFKIGFLHVDQIVNCAHLTGDNRLKRKRPHFNLKEQIRPSWNPKPVRANLNVINASFFHSTFACMTIRLTAWARKYWMTAVWNLRVSLWFYTLNLHNWQNFLPFVSIVLTPTIGSCL